MVAVWCFIRERFVPAGILCLAVSLAVKPQDAGLVWLYFLLVGGVYPKRALQTLVAMLALGLPGNPVGLERSAKLAAGMALEHTGVFCTWRDK